MISILVTPHVSALAGCDRLVSEPLVIERFILRLNKFSHVSPWDISSSLGNCHATGLRLNDPKTGIWLKRINRKIRIPIDLYPCRVEEKLTMKEVDGETIMKLETKMIAKDGTVSKFLGKFPGYTPSKEEEEEPEKKG
ncbi:hypothetical protein Tco_0631486 [Tanacetum coccineum]